MNPREFSLYVLVDPTSKAIRYVGKTVQPVGIRLKRHIRDALEKTMSGDWADRTHRANWIRKVLWNQQVPVINTLCQYRGLMELNAAEKFFIKHLKALDSIRPDKRLTNATAGGDGCIVPRSPSCSDEQVIAAYQAGLSSVKISKQFKTCKKRVLSVLDRAGIPLRKAGAQKRDR